MKVARWRLVLSSLQSSLELLSFLQRPAIVFPQSQKSAKRQGGFSVLL